MCYRYTLETDDLLPILDELGIYSTAGLEARTEMFPLRAGPVVYDDESARLSLENLQWGFLPSWWKPSSRTKTPAAFQRKCFNARSESVHEKPTFRTAFRQRRCLAPATAFFEKGQFFQLRDGRPFFFASLWEKWQGEDKEIRSYTILTTEANDLVQDVGHPRMPVILDDRKKWDLWLNPDITDRELLQELFEPLSPVLMEQLPEEEFVSRFRGKA